MIVLVDRFVDYLKLSEELVLICEWEYLKMNFHLLFSLQASSF